MWKCINFIDELRNKQKLNEIDMQKFGIDIE